MKLVLGIDGGASKTQAVILDEQGTPLGMGFGGPANYNTVGLAQTRDHVAEAVQTAFAQAGLTPRPFDAAFFGMASVVSEIDFARIRTIATDLGLAPAAQTGVDHDCRIALAGGLSGRPGMVQIAGTGSSTFGINAQGQGWRSGGWGHLIADEGSGYWLGLKAMEAAVRAYDGRLPSHNGSATVLQGEVMRFLNLREMNEIYQPLYVNPLEKHEIARLAPIVLQAAADDDPVARQIIDLGAEEMAACVVAVAQRLGMVGAEAGPLEIALVGGLFQAGDIYVQPFAQAINRRRVTLGRDCRLLWPELPPVMGAAVLALEMLDIRLSPAALARLHTDHKA
jgi:N-acetylglucosamine kinase-like BadF-type ATPase